MKPREKCYKKEQSQIKIAKYSKSQNFLIVEKGDREKEKGKSSNRKGSMKGRCEKGK